LETCPLGNHSSSAQKAKKLVTIQFFANNLPICFAYNQDCALLTRVEENPSVTGLK
jgi:hypothetical protein